MEKRDRAVGVLQPVPAGPDAFRERRWTPSPDLAFFIEHYWSVRWDLRGRGPHVQDTLPHPSVHIAFEPGRPMVVYGVVTGKFSVTLEGAGSVFGIKFRPGAFHPFLRAPVSTLTDRTVPLSAVFGDAGDALGSAMLATDDDEVRIAVAERFLRERDAERDPNVELVGAVAERIVADRSITTVRDVVARSELDTRTLQRLFRRYVGVSPKWVIRRYRLHEAASRLDAGATVDFSRLAIDLGYFDQAHFINDFRAIVGLTPAEYARRASARWEPDGGGWR
ncbi:MAG TPA: helix-turn-helix domain-containing protein [Gemmatimonadaceae bacterium]